MPLPVILCIGSSGVSGDSLGPLVGDLLRRRYNVKAFVYGCPERPVNGLNYTQYIEHIERVHHGSVVIAVDACVGSRDDVGKIKFSPSGLTAGGALNKNLRRFGDLGVLGVVAPRQQDNLSALMQVPFSFVDEMSRAAARGVVRILAALQAGGTITYNTPFSHKNPLQSRVFCGNIYDNLSISSR